MDQREPKGYKRYLDPTSDGVMPPSSWYKMLGKRRLLGTHRDGSRSGCHENLQPDRHHEKERITSTAGEFNELEPDKVVLGYALPLTAKQEAPVVIDSLVEEMDSIVNERSPLHKGGNDERNDLLLHEPDADEFENDTAENEDHCEMQDSVGEDVLRGCSSLQDAIFREAFRKRITTPVDKTFGEVILIILKFVLVHALSLTETTDLFHLIDSLFPEPVLRGSRFLIDKLFFPKNRMKTYAICSECGASLGTFGREDVYLTCNICQTVAEVKDSGFKDFFVTMDVADPIAKLIEANSEYYENVVRRRVVEDGHIRDIYDGRRYRAFIESLSEEDRSSYATLCFNTDGAPLFESSSQSIWPIFLMVNEVPFHVRTKELILAGIWFGKDKPNMTVFLEPFVDNMNELANTGVECTISGDKRRLKICTLLCCVDAVARAPVHGFTQFNGSYGCGHCLHPGEWVRGDPNNPRSGNTKYPLQNNAPQNRNVADTIKHMSEAEKCKKPIFGVKGPSHLINLKHYDIIHGNVIDSLHCAAGIAKQFATKWFGNNKKSGLLPRSTVKTIDDRMSNVKAPHQVVRLARTLSDKEFWKAREWENWILFYSIPVLRDVLPAGLLAHWALFPAAFYILTKSETTIREVETADDLLREFICQTELLYGKTAMTFNVHSLGHLAQSVADWGPLWSHNTYGFESGNGDLLKVIHAAKGVYHQICRRISMRYSYVTLKDHIYPDASSSVKQYCETLGTSMAKRTVRQNDIRYFGAVSRVDELWLRRLRLGEHSVTYRKIVKDSCLYMSAQRANKRSDNSYAILHDDTYVRILYFIVDSANREEYTIVDKIKTADACAEYPMLRTVLASEDLPTAVRTSNIVRVCVHTKIADREYVCAVPNLYHY